MGAMDRLVTVIGGGGFLGRYVAQELLATGVRIRVAERDPGSAFEVRPLGGLGQTQFVSADIRKPVTLGRAVAGADAVINLVGILKGDFEAFHVKGAEAVAAAARDAGARALVHISAIGADPDAESAYGRTKGEGEARVRAAFPGATILRPSILFGPDDQFVNRFAEMARMMPVLPVLRGDVKFQPAYVVDVARAVAAAALEPTAHAGRTYELGGPQQISMGELNRWIVEAIGYKRQILEVPDTIGEALARFTGFLPGAPLSWDQWLMLQKDNVVETGAEGFAAFGIAPTPLAAVAPDWLVRYRRHGRFSTGRAA